MEAKDFQIAARDAAQIAHIDAVARMAAVVANPDCDPELAVKIFNATKDVAQALPKDKNDAYANLPMFHIHLHNGKVGATEIDMGSVSEIFDMETVTIPPAMKAAAILLNQEVIDV